MLKMIVLMVALCQQHGPAFRAGWEKAKARADMWDRYRHGQIDRLTLAQEQLRLATPQEMDWFLKYTQSVLDEQKRRDKANDAMLQRINEAHERWKAKRLVGPPPPDLK